MQPQTRVVLAAVLIAASTYDLIAVPGGALVWALAALAYLLAAFQLWCVRFGRRRPRGPQS